MRLQVALGYDLDTGPPTTPIEALASELDSRLLPLAGGLMRLRLLHEALQSLEEQVPCPTRASPTLDCPTRASPTLDCPTRASPTLDQQPHPTANLVIDLATVLAAAAWRADVS